MTRSHIYIHTNTHLNGDDEPMLPVESCSRKWTEVQQWYTRFGECGDRWDEGENENLREEIEATLPVSLFCIIYYVNLLYIYIGLLIHYLIMSGQVPVGSAQVLVEVPPHQIRVQSSRWPVSDFHVGLQDRLNLVYASTWSCKMVTIVDSSPTPPLQGKPHRALVAGSSV